MIRSYDFQFFFLCFERSFGKWCCVYRLALLICIYVESAEISASDWRFPTDRVHRAAIVNAEKKTEVAWERSLELELM